AKLQSLSVYISLILQGSITELGDGALAGCTTITSVTIPASVTTFWDNIFYGCTSLIGPSALNIQASGNWKRVDGSGNEEPMLTPYVDAFRASTHSYTYKIES
ncbi:MAG: leucine-rich repeat domain-containing protein, partial [Treponema sp.]|nr:leucine-rich repeat domain-containing protein [Treponema sp.]